jgi:hypothetical protein
VNKYFKVIIIIFLTSLIAVLSFACSAIDPNIDREIKDLVKNIPYPSGYNYVYNTGEKIEYRDISVDYVAIRIYDENTGVEITPYYILLYTKNDGIFALGQDNQDGHLTSLSAVTSLPLNYIRIHYNDGKLSWIRWEK